MFDTLIQFINRVVLAFSDITMRLAYRGAVLLQKFWAWWQNLNKPNIPLSALQWVSLVYLVLAILFMFATPPLEAGEELTHLQHIQAIQTDTHIIDADNIQPLDLAPSAYHWLSAQITAPIIPTDTWLNTEPNPYFRAQAFAIGNKNAFLQPTLPSESSSPIYVLRIINILLGLGVVVLAHRIARLLAPKRPVTALIGATFVAFNPMFLFLVASVHSLPIVMLLSSIVIHSVLMMLIYGFASRTSIVLMLALGALVLFDASGWLLAGGVLLLLLWRAFQHREWRPFALTVVGVIGAIALMGGFWLWNNLQTWGEPFATTLLWQVLGERVVPLDVSGVWSEFQRFRLSFWGIFGAGNILTSNVWYALMDMVVFTAMGGVIFLLMQLYAIRDFSYARREMTGVLGALTILLIGLVAYMVMFLRVQSVPGYWLFPFMGIIAPLLAMGFVEVVWWVLFMLSPPERSFVRAGEAVSDRLQTQAHGFMLVYIVLFVFALPWITMRPAYAEPITHTVLPSSADVMFADFGEVALMGYDIAQRRYLPGEDVSVTLFWRADEVTSSDLMVSVALINDSGEELGKYDTFPAMGTLRTSQWQTDVIYEDTMAVRLSPFIEQPQTFRLHVTWWNRQDQARLIPSNREEQIVQAVTIPIGAVVPPIQRDVLSDYTQLPTETRDRARWSEQIKLLAFEYDEQSMELSLFWETNNALKEDYTVFAHIYDAEGNLVGQADVAPSLPTSYWRYGEQYVTIHELAFFDAPLAGDYTLEVGWYAQSGERLILPIQSEDEPTPTRLTLFSFNLDAFGTFVSDELDALRAQAQEEATAEEAPDPDLTPESTADD